MGSGSKPKASAQPRKIFPNGNVREGISTGTGGVTSGGAMTDQELEFNLNHLNPDLLEKTANGDSIRIESATSPFQVMTSAGRLGDVPERYEAKIKQSNLLSGSVVRIKLDPASVRVVLRH